MIRKTVCFHCYFSFLRYLCGSPGLVLPRSLETAHFLCHPILNENVVQLSSETHPGGLPPPDDSSSTCKNDTDHRELLQVLLLWDFKKQNFQNQEIDQLRFADTTQHPFFSPCPKKMLSCCLLWIRWRLMLQELRPLPVTFLALRDRPNFFPQGKVWWWLT